MFFIILRVRTYYNILLDLKLFRAVLPNMYRRVQRVGLSAEVVTWPDHVFENRARRPYGRKLRPLHFGTANRFRDFGATAYAAIVKV